MSHIDLRSKLLSLFICDLSPARVLVCKLFISLFSLCHLRPSYHPSFLLPVFLHIIAAMTVLYSVFLSVKPDAFIFLSSTPPVEQRHTIT